METIVAIRENDGADISQLAKQIARESLGLADLNRGELEMLARAARGSVPTLLMHVDNVQAKAILLDDIVDFYGAYLTCRLSRVLKVLSMAHPY